MIYQSCQNNIPQPLLTVERMVEIEFGKCSQLGYWIDPDVFTISPEGISNHSQRKPQILQMYLSEMRFADVNHTHP